jgi:hypothetical protein
VSELPSGQVAVEVVGAQLEPRREPLDDRHQPGPVRLAGGREAQRHEASNPTRAGILRGTVAGFFIFALAGFVFGYAAPKAWALLPVVVPLAVGLYTGLRDKFDGELILLILLGVGVTLAGVALGRMLLYRLEGREAAA